MASKLATRIPIFIMDAFTSGENERYTGNSAAVCFLEFDDDICDETKQKIAATMNLSETTFVSRDWKMDATLSSSENGTNDNDRGRTTINRKIRWFTPAREIELCGHATFASVHALTKYLKNDCPFETVIFDTKFSGKLTAKIESDDNEDKQQEPLITLNFPTTSLVPVGVSQSLDWLPELEEILLGPKFTKGATVEDMQFCPPLGYLQLRLKRVDGERPFETIRKIEPNFQQLAAAKTGPIQVGAFIVTIQNDEVIGKGHSRQNPIFYSRVFAPYYGITEDPVCGSAHTLLVPYWLKALGIEAGQKVWGHQASDRSGDLCCQLVDDNRVELSGRGQVVLQGELRV